MKCVSLFAGIGGFDLALIRQGHKIVYANEWDKYATQTYEKNFKSKPDTRDITTVGVDEIPDCELLVGGFPCQPFSIAGHRRGFEDTRGTLFFEITRILKGKRPKYLLLENVKGLLSHDSGWTFKRIIQTLDELGYDLQWQVLNSKNFGVPQNRERVFIVGNLRGTGRPQVFPITGGNKEDSVQYSNTLRVGYGNKWSNETYVATLTPGRATKRQNGRRFKEQGEPMFTLTGMDIHGVSNGIRIRRLTPIECERLQGFPDGFTEGISDTQRYKQLGNAVTVPVVMAIVERFCL
jgi:DNA (cytosine-5)-methyltransferase 1